jgi:hypothetical protein
LTYASRELHGRGPAVESVANAVGNVEDPRFEKSEAADFDVGICAWNVEEAGTVSVADAKILDRRSHPRGKIRCLHARDGRNTRR